MNRQAGSRAADAWGDQIDRWVDAHREALIQTASELIRIPTENLPPHGNEWEGQLFVQGIMQGMAAEVDVFEPTDVPELTQHPAYWPGRDYRKRPNVVGRWRGSGGGRSLCFSSHMDTAPREPLPWEVTDPFSGEVIDGRLYGRGSYDMKGGLVASLFAVRAVRELQIPLRGDVIVESVVDEEWGGSNGTLASRLRGHRADLAILPEPSHMVICPAHLGVRVFRLVARGQSGMRFGGEELTNPVLSMGRLLTAFETFARRHQAKPLPPLYAGGNPPPVDILRIHAEGYGVPDRCELDFFLHCFEWDTAESLQQAVEELLVEVWGEDHAAEIQHLTRFLPPSAIDPSHPGVEAARRAVAGVRPGQDVVRGAPFACDAYVFNLHADMPAVILGPSGASAHGKDEYVQVEDLIDLAKIYARLVVDWCS